MRWLFSHGISLFPWELPRDPPRDDGFSMVFPMGSHGISRGVSWDSGGVAWEPPWYPVGYHMEDSVGSSHGINI